MTDGIFYTDEEPIDADQFVSLLNADIMMTAWDGDLLVGVARSVTDFAYCCYLSDLAVDRDYQRRGIGAALMDRTEALLAPGAKLILLAAPDADGYYGTQGFERHPRAWARERGPQPSANSAKAAS